MTEITFLVYHNNLTTVKQSAEPDDVVRIRFTKNEKWEAKLTYSERYSQFNKDLLLIPPEYRTECEKQALRIISQIGETIQYGQLKNFDPSEYKNIMTQAVQQNEEPFVREFGLYIPLSLKNSEERPIIRNLTKWLIETINQHNQPFYMILFSIYQLWEKDEQEVRNLALETTRNAIRTHKLDSFIQKMMTEIEETRKLLGRDPQLGNVWEDYINQIETEFGTTGLAKYV